MGGLPRLANEIAGKVTGRGGHMLGAVGDVLYRFRSRLARRNRACQPVDDTST